MTCTRIKSALCCTGTCAGVGGTSNDERLSGVRTTTRHPEFTDFILRTHSRTIGGMRPSQYVNICLGIIVPMYAEFLFLHSSRLMQLGRVHLVLASPFLRTLHLLGGSLFDKPGFLKPTFSHMPRTEGCPGGARSPRCSAFGAAVRRRASVRTGAQTAFEPDTASLKSERYSWPKPNEASLHFNEDPAPRGPTQTTKQEDHSLDAS